MKKYEWIRNEDGEKVMVEIGSPQHQEHEFQRNIKNEVYEQSLKKANMKKGKVTKCQFTREWDGPSGTIYYHTIVIDNGDHGSVGTKEKMPAKLSEGSEIWYSIEQKGNFKGQPQYSIKLEKAPDQQYQPKQYAMSNQSNSNQQESIARSVALKAAIDAVGAGEQPAAYVNVALYFEHYLLTGKQANEDAVNSSITDKKMDASTDDLPF
jgi:hypothetical protein